MSRVLLVEDDEHLAEGLAFNLRNRGYDVDIAETGEEGLEAVAAAPYDLILLDVMLPGIDGLEVVRRLRQGGRTQPVIMLTARDRAGDATEGIDAGADDYIMKPFDIDEVLARIRGALRRQVWGRASPGGPPPDRMRYGKWEVDLRNFRARDAEGAEIRLTAKEIAMLKYFASRPGEVISREEFLEDVWGLPSTMETRTVDNFVRRLRRTLEEDPSSPRHILSIRGAGYRYVP